VSLIVFKTLSEVFSNVLVDTTHGVVVFIASSERHDIVSFVGKDMLSIVNWMESASLAYPVNSLNDLAMNRYKFTATGNSTYEQLEEKYKAMREVIYGNH